MPTKEVDTYANLLLLCPSDHKIVDEQVTYYTEQRLIQAFTQTWGGEYFIIVPTDGKTIDEKFWEILEAYSPDELGRYLPSLLDLEDADPAQYQKIKEQYKNAWEIENDEDFENTWNSEARRSAIGSLEISKELSEELKSRLACKSRN
jgi:hypothetical protein